MNLFTKIFFIIFLSFSILISCDNQKAGTFAVKFSWAKDGEGKEIKPDVSTGEFFVTVRIYEWKEGVTFPGDIAANGKQLIQSDPAQMKATGTSIDFGDLSYGNRRFVVAEIRKGEELTGGILFTGMSQLFDFKAGKHTEVNVNMSMTPTPGVDEEGKRIDAELRIVDDNGNLRSYTSGTDLKVKLRLLNAVSFTHVYFANKEENIKTANGKSYKIGELKKIKGVENGYELDGEWDLSFGLTADEIAVLPELKVYARLENEYGTGLLVMAKIALDNQSPELTLGLNPVYTNGSKTITLNISANELIKHDSLNIQTTNEKLVFDCPAPTKNESLSFSCTVETLDAALKDGDYEITVSATDQAGNSTEDKTMLVIDRTNPDIEINSCAVTTRRAITKNGIAAASNDDVVEITLEMDKETGIEPVITLGNKLVKEECSVPSENCFAYTVSVNETEGYKFVGVDASDEAGNVYSETIDLEECSVVFDFTGPRLTSETLTRIPDYSAAWDDVNKVLYFSLKDPYSDTPVSARLVVSADETLLAGSVSITGFSFGDPTVTNTRATFSTILTNETTPGEKSLTISWSDELGNVSTNLPLEWKMNIDTEPPTVASLDLDKIWYVRKPWGTNDTGGVARFAVTGTDAVLDTDLSTVLVYSSTGQLIGRDDTLSGGSIDIPTLTSGDLTEVYFAPVKRSGVKMTLGDPVDVTANLIKVKNVEWHATMGGKVAGSIFENPHTYFSVPFFREEFLDQYPSELIEIVENPFTTTGHGRWEEVTPSEFSARILHNMVYDSVRKKVVLFGGKTAEMSLVNDTWEWDGSNLTLRISTTNPSERFNHAMTYDSYRGKVVMFGGSTSSGGNNETWEWDGTNWTQMNPANKPSERFGHAMVYDSVRGKVVLFGGYTNSGVNNETWEWDGTNWTQMNPASKPSERFGHAMAYDIAVGKVIIFGGSDIASTFNNETWEWDGNNWNQLNPINNPWSRSHHAITYDINRGRIVLFGGSKEGTINNETWEWDGTNWIQMNPATKPSARSHHTMTYDSYRGKVVLFGGTDGLYKDDTWEWDGVNWTQIKHKVKPSERFSHAMVYNEVNGKVILFGGYDQIEVYNDTWEWDGVNWTQLNPENKPSERYQHSMVFDSTRKRVLLFGGYTKDSLPINDTWEWDGVNWTQLNPEVKPSARYNHAMAYDNIRGKVVMFGGRPGGDETWEWDGVNWTQLNPVTKPSARSGHAMVYNKINGKVVMFGGFVGDDPNFQDAYLNETWEWDGVNWIQIISDVKLSALSFHTMTYDSDREKIFLFGGSSGLSYHDDIRECDGMNWRQLNLSKKPSIRIFSGIIYDNIKDMAVLIGGHDGFQSLIDIWEWDGGAYKRPAQIMETVLDVSGAKKWYPLVSINAKFYAGGIGYPNTTATTGSQIMVWDGTTWKSVAQNTVGADGPFNDTSKLEWTTTDPQQMYSLLTGDQRAINFAVVPVAPNGSASEMGKISVSYAEVTIRYTIVDTKDEHIPSGYFDGAADSFISGWACDKDTPEENIHVVLSFYTGETYLTSIDIGETNNPSEQGVQDICGEGSTTHRFSFNPSTSAELQQALDDKFISRPVTLTVHAYGMNTGPVPPGSNTELGDSPKEFVY